MPSRKSQPSAEPGAGLRRRELLKIIGLGPAASILPAAAAAETAAAQAPASASATAAPQLKSLNRQEFDTIALLSDWILPADERSGSASQAGVPAFIDDWLAFQGDWLSAEIRGGLAWLDLECNRLYKHDFSRCSTAEQKKMIDRMAWPHSAAPEDSHAVAFFNRLRNLVLGGFYSSPMGVKDLPYLGNQMIPEWNGGAPPAVLARLGLTEEEEENQRWLRQRQAEGHWVQRPLPPARRS